MKNVPNSLRLAAVSLAAVIFTGCVTRHFGDARIQKRPDAFSITADRFSLRPVPLDPPGAHVLHALDLPFPLYPTHLLVPLTPTEAELKQDFPWAQARLRIEFRAPDGVSFFSTDVALADAQPGRTPGTKHQLELQFRPTERRSWKAPENMPHHTSYDVLVTVLEPSLNKTHRATLYASTYVR